MTHNIYQLFPILLLTLSLVSVPTPPPPTANQSFIPYGPERVFFADDPDHLRTQPLVERIHLRSLPHDPELIRVLAMAYDFYYTTTSPVVQTDHEPVTYDAVQRAKLDSITHNLDSSRWYDSSKPVDGVYIKDATIQIVRIENSAILQAPGTKAHGQQLIPDSGVVLTHTDFRIDDTALPENHCTQPSWEYEEETYRVTIPIQNPDGTTSVIEEKRTRDIKVDGQQRCYSYQLEEVQTNKSLRVGEFESLLSEGESSSTAVLTYSNTQAIGPTSLRVKADLRIIEKETVHLRDWDPGDGWSIDTTTIISTPYRVTVADSSPVLVTSNQQLTVHQHVFRGVETNGVVLVFDGPPNLIDRRLWTQAIFTDELALGNVWGVYSVSRISPGYVSSNDAPEVQRADLPVVLDMFITARTTNVQTNFVAGDSPGVVEIPEVINIDREQLGVSPTVLPAGVNLTTSPTYRYDTVVVKHAPAVRSVLDIHGDPVPLETTVHRVHRSTLTLSETGSGAVELRLRSLENRAGISDRVIKLTGASQRSVRTNETGQAILSPAGKYVTAEFSGDDWAIEHPIVYGPATSSIAVDSGIGSIVGAVQAMILQLKFIGIWIILALFGWIWYQGR